MKRLALLCLLAFACSSLYAGTTRKVPADHATIQDAVDNSVTGDIIALSKNATTDGVYYENVVVPDAIDSLTFTGKAIWDGNVGGTAGTCLTIIGPSPGPFLISGVIFRNGDFAVETTTGDVDGITLSGCQAQFITSRFMETTGDNLTVTKCTVLGCAEGLSCTSSNAVISGNKFIQCSGNGIEIGDNLGTEQALIEKNAFFLHDGGQLVNITSDNTKVISTSAKTCSGGIRITGDNSSVTGSSFTHVTGGIRITEASATGNNRAEKNKLSITDGTALSIRGVNAVVTGNSVSGCTGAAIQTDDSSPDVLGNKIKFADSGIFCDSGVGTLVDKNSILTILNGHGIQVNGDNVTVTNNSVGDVNGGDGLLINDLVAGGAQVDKNKVKNVSGNGIRTSVDGSTTPSVISNCTVSFAGTGNNSGIHVSGDETDVTKCKVSNIDGDGIRIDASDCVITDCSATKCGIDGFDSDNTSFGNAFTNCKASACGGEGFDNSASTSTVVTGGSFTKNRIDFAGNGGATFGTPPPKIGDTSGLATAPEVD